MYNNIVFPSLGIEIKFHHSVKGENRPLVTEDKSYTLTVMREEVVWVWDCERKIEKDQ